MLGCSTASRPGIVPGRGHACDRRAVVCERSMVLSVPYGRAPGGIEGAMLEAPVTVLAVAHPFT